MSFGEFVKGQFADVIEHVDESGKLLVSRYERYGDEIKQGAALIVREGQTAVFICKGQIADVFKPGSYKLTTGNLPVLSSLKAVGRLFNSPIKSDLYFINTTRFIANRWGTKNPIIMRDADMGMVRMTAFGSYSFRVKDPVLFIREIFGARKLNMTYEIMSYLSSFISEAVAAVLASEKIPVLELASDYRSLGELLTRSVNQRASLMGIEVDEAVIENVGLPPEVEQLIDEQSGLGLASKNMDDYMRYHTVRAMRDAAKQKGGLAGLGAGAAIGRAVAETMSETQPREESPAAKIREYKGMLDEGLISEEEYNALKKQLLKL